MSLPELPIVDSPPAVEVGQTAHRPRRLPPWMRVNLPLGDLQKIYGVTNAAVHERGLHTVCEEAKCPNIHDCWAQGTATFMVAGKECTRGCRFCAVQTLKAPELPDAEEPLQLASAVRQLQLEHVVITVVNRDDLPDGGADHYRACIDAVHAASPATTIELLCSDLAGNTRALAALLADCPLDVFAHNVECVPRLDAVVRDPRASFRQSIEILAASHRLRRDVWTKSSLMVGVGETDAEVVAALKALREAGVALLTLGQYVAPSGKHLPVDRWVHPQQFAAWAELAIELGFLGVASGPLVRSSYRAGELLAAAQRGEPLMTGGAAAMPVS